jgi:cation:H+ antiporter
MAMDILLLLVACLAILLSSNLAISAIHTISPLLRVSKLTISLLVLGLVTSLPEITITINSVLFNAPQIAVGTLIGSQVFLLFVTIPVLAIISNGLSLKFEMKNVSLALSLLLALVPMIALYNQSIDIVEALAITGLYLAFIFIYTQKSNVVQRFVQRYQEPSASKIMLQVTLFLLSIGILLLASNTAVRSIIEIAAVLETPRFLLSMILLPVATNLPELVLAIGYYSTIKKDVVIADYLGSMTVNSFILAALTISLGGSIGIGQNISMVIILFIIGLIAFWLASASKQVLSSKEGLLFFCFYILILLVAGWQVMSRFN